jgi:hypothetical protein
VVLAVRAERLREATDAAGSVDGGADSAPAGIGEGDPEVVAVRELFEGVCLEPGEELVIAEGRIRFVGRHSVLLRRRTIRNRTIRNGNNICKKYGSISRQVDR